MDAEQQEREEWFDKWIKATLTKPDKPQYIPKMRMSEYHAAPGANGSTFLKPTPRHMKAEAMTPPEVNYAFALGDALHIATLEPERFDLEHGEEEFFQYVPNGKGLGTKAAREAFAADPSKPVVTPELISKARYMRDAIFENHLARQLLSPPADKELSGFVWDEDAQCLKKIRLDFRPKKGNYNLDLKSCDDASEHGFWNSVRKFKYGAKAGFYADCDAEINNTNPRPLFYLVAVEGPKAESAGVFDKPYACQVFDIGSPVEELSLMADGRSYYRDRLSVFANAARTNTWEAWQHQQEATVLTVFRPRFTFKTKQPEDDQ